MKLTKKAPVKRASHKNCYKFHIDFMIGDADGFQNEELFISENDPFLERFVEFLNNCQNAFPDGRGGRDSYNKIKDRWLFCNYYEVNDQQRLEQESLGWELSWPGEPYSGDEMTFYGYVVTYFDENGIEFEVEIDYEI